MKFFKEKKNTFYEVKNNSSSFLFPFLSRERPTTCGFFKCFTKERHLIIIMGERDSRDSLKNNTTKKHEKFYSVGAVHFIQNDHSEIN